VDPAPNPGKQKLPNEKFSAILFFKDPHVVSRGLELLLED
jgi:hypothetical protein